MADNAGRRVLVTGGASGLGAALAEAFGRRGDRVLVGDLVPTAPGHRYLDVTSDADWADVAQWVGQNWGGLDILVNNAGIATGGRIDVAGMDEWYRAVEVNLLGAIATIEAKNATSTARVRNVVNEGNRPSDRRAALSDPVGLRVAHRAER